jgi:hypothetical protein
VQNGPFFASSKTWIAYDRGPENWRLLRLAPGRRAFLYDEASGTLRSISAPDSGDVARHSGS